MRLSLVLLVLLAVACEGAERPAASQPRAASASVAAALVEVSPAQGGELADRWTFLGNVRAGMQAELAAAAAGEVRWVGAREGDQVARGTVFVRVDARLARAALQTTRARELGVAETLAQAGREVARLSRLSREARTELELERAQSAVRLARAQIALLAAERHEAVARLALHEVRAPFAGVVTRRLVDPGDWVAAGTRVVELVSSGDQEVLVDVSPRLLSFIKLQSRATLLPTAGPALSAKVVGIVGALDPVARTARVRLLPEGAKKGVAGALRPGAAIRVAFEIHRAGGVAVARDALVVGPTSTRVVKVVDGKAVPVRVEVLATGETRALVVAVARAGRPVLGLKAGDLLIVRGNERVRPGQPVRVSAGGVPVPTPAAAKGMRP